MAETKETNLVQRYRHLYFICALVLCVPSIAILAMTFMTDRAEPALQYLAAFCLCAGLFALFRAIFSKGRALDERNEPHFAALRAHPQPLYYDSVPISEACKVFKRSLSGVVLFESYSIQDGVLIQNRFGFKQTFALRDVRGYHILPRFLSVKMSKGRTLCFVDANGSGIGSISLDCFDSLSLENWAKQNLVEVPAEMIA